MRGHDTIFVSPFIQITKERNKSRVCNTISGKTFEVGSEIINILIALKHPRRYEELVHIIGDYQKSLPGIVEFLLGEGILIERGKESKALTGVTPVYERLFNFPHYNPKVPGLKIPFVGVPFGKGNPRSIATGKFPWYLRTLTHQLHLNLHQKIADGLRFESISTFLDDESLRGLISKGALTDFGNIFIDMNEDSSFVYEKIYTIAKSLFKNDTIPFFIGGDHSISYPLIKAASEKYQDLHVIHFDAHTDTYTLPHDRLEYNGKVHHHGNFAYRCLQDTQVKEIYQFGIRGVSNLQQEELPRQRIYWCSQLKELIRNGGKIDLPNDVPYYVTFDIDVMDPAFAPGTATPVTRGFTPEEIQKLFHLTLANKHIVGFDIVEASQEHDKANLTTELAIEIILSLISFIGSDRSLNTLMQEREAQVLQA